MKAKRGIRDRKKTKAKTPKRRANSKTLSMIRAFEFHLGGLVQMNRALLEQFRLVEQAQSETLRALAAIQKDLDLAIGKDSPSGPELQKPLAPLYLVDADESRLQVQDEARIWREATSEDWEKYRALRARQADTAPAQASDAASPSSVEAKLDSMRYFSETEKIEAARREEREREFLRPLDPFLR